MNRSSASRSRTSRPLACSPVLMARSLHPTRRRFLDEPQVLPGLTLTFILVRLAAIVRCRFRDDRAAGERADHLVYRPHLVMLAVGHAVRGDGEGLADALLGAHHGPPSSRSISAASRAAAWAYRPASVSSPASAIADSCDGWMPGVAY